MNTFVFVKRERLLWIVLLLTWFSLVLVPAESHLHVIVIASHQEQESDEPITRKDDKTLPSDFREGIQQWLKS